MSRDSLARFIACVILVLSATVAFFVYRLPTDSFFNGFILGASGGLSALMLVVIGGGAETLTRWKARWSAALDLLRRAS